MFIQNLTYLVEWGWKGYDINGKVKGENGERKTKDVHSELDVRYFSLVSECE